MYILLIICFLELPLTIFCGFLIIPIVILDNYPQYYKTEPFKSTIMKSKLFTLDYRDLLNGLLIAFLAAFIDGIIKILGSGVAFDWPHLQPVVIAGISAALAYLLKSLSTNSRNQLFTKEPG